MLRMTATQEAADAMAHQFENEVGTTAGKLLHTPDCPGGAGQIVLNRYGRPSYACRPLPQDVPVGCYGGT